MQNLPIGKNTHVCFSSVNSIIEYQHGVKYLINDFITLIARTFFFYCFEQNELLKLSKIKCCSQSNHIQICKNYLRESFI